MMYIYVLLVRVFSWNDVDLCAFHFQFSTDRAIPKVPKDFFQHYTIDRYPPYFEISYSKPIMI